MKNIIFLFFCLIALSANAQVDISPSGKVTLPGTTPSDEVKPKTEGDRVAMETKKIIRGETPILAKDNIMLQTFDKNWSNCLLVADWTGSMYDFAPRILEWQYSKKTDAVSKIVLFNDGDGHPDGPIGKTGGIYFIDNPNDMDLVANTVKKVVDAGGGGGTEENDLEAVIKSCEKYPSYKYVVLVADGRSGVRDISLLSKIRVPVHVIFCGAGGAESDYLRIAYETGGSVRSLGSSVDFSSSKSTSVNFNGKRFVRDASGSWRIS